MPHKKILWLCSWYPGKTEPFNGDFIQRHARAAALYNNIYVIHVIGDSSGTTIGTGEEINHTGNLTEHLIYYKRSSSSWRKWRARHQWLTLFRRAVIKYIRENGIPHLVHVHVPMKAGIVGMWIKKKYNIPYIVTEHWGIYNEIERANYHTKTALFRRFTKAIFKNALKFVSVSRYLAEGINRLVIKKAWEVIPNTVDTDVFFYQKMNKTPFRFIHVSNMVPLKNAEGIVRAFKSLLQNGSHALLQMVGDTDPAIREYAASLSLKDEAISFCGEIPYGQVATEMQNSHCLILFSNIENSPCVIGESLCCGIPVIATRVGGIPELVNETNAILIGPGDDAALTKAMEQMMNDYPGYDGEKIAAEAKQVFSYTVVGKKLDDIYSSIPGDKS